MKLIDLIAAIDADPESDIKIQICHPGRSWEDYDTFNAGSKLLKPFQDFVYHRSEIRFLRGRLKFGDSKNSAPFPSMIVIFRGPKM